MSGHAYLQPIIYRLIPFISGKASRPYGFSINSKLRFAAWSCNSAVPAYNSKLFQRVRGREFSFTASKEREFISCRKYKHIGALHAAVSLVRPSHPPASETVRRKYLSAAWRAPIAINIRIKFYCIVFAIFIGCA